MQREIYPARLNVKDTAKRLGFKEHDIPVLMARKKLTPLGKPVPNATKYFAACEIEKLARDTDWLGDATQAIYDDWKKKNLTKSKNIIPLAAHNKSNPPREQAALAE